jgi:hypothetical protein
MVNPTEAGPGVCAICRTFNGREYTKCYKCDHQPSIADVVVPITYSIDGEQMHYSLRAYKDGATAAIKSKFTLELAAVLWRFLRLHECCVAAAARVDSFEIVTVVPSGTAERDDARGALRTIVGHLVELTAGRFERILLPTDSSVPARRYDAERYEPARELDGGAVLLIDDTWTTGASVQAAAAALKRGGASRVAAVVIGRHINAGYEDNGARLKALPRGFRWETCAFHRQD